MKFNLLFLGEIEVTLYHLFAIFLTLVSTGVLGLIFLVIGILTGIVSIQAILGYAPQFLLLVSPIITVSIFYSLTKNKDIKNSIGLFLFYLIISLGLTAIVYSGSESLIPIVLMNSLESSVIFGVLLAGLFAAFDKNNRKIGFYGALLFLGLWYVFDYIVFPYSTSPWKNLTELLILPSLSSVLLALILGFSISSLIAELKMRNKNQNKYLFVFAVPFVLVAILTLIRSISNPNIAVVLGVMEAVRNLIFSALYYLIFFENEKFI